VLVLAQQQSVVVGLEGHKGGVLWVMVVRALGWVVTLMVVPVLLQLMPPVLAPMAEGVGVLLVLLLMPQPDPHVCPGLT
jgi:hypothetical protein